MSISILLLCAVLQSGQQKFSGWVMMHHAERVRDTHQRSCCGLLLEFYVEHWSIVVDV